MTDDPQLPEQKDKSRRTEAEWTFSFEQLEQFGESVAGWLNQLGIGADADLQHTTLSEPLGACEQARVRLDLTVGRAMIGALPEDSPNLIEIDVVSIGAVEMTASTENSTKSVRLRQKRTSGGDFFKPVKDAVDVVARNNELKWVVRLSPRVALTLDVDASLTVDQFDLTGLKLKQFKMDGSTGHTVVRFPAQPFTANIEGGVGVLDLHIPDTAKTTLNLDAGAGATNLFIGAAGVKATIEGGVGNCTIHVPADAALRVRADSGLGNIVVPETSRSVEFESEFISESGLWETEGFEFAPEKIDIRYEGGVGSLIVQATPPSEG